MLLRKNEPHAWNDKCQKAYKLIKEHLLHSPILVPLKHGKPLLLYLSIIENVVRVCLHKIAIYYLSKGFHDYETRYTPIEKSCFTLMRVVLKLRHIILPF